MTIQDTGNNDGITIVGRDGDCAECSVGNFDDLKIAKKWATLWFMIQRPATFGHSIWLRVGREDRQGTCHEFYLLRDYCRKNKIAIPKDITESKDMNASILCCGERI